MVILRIRIVLRIVIVIAVVDVVVVPPRDGGFGVVRQWSWRCVVVVVVVVLW